MKKQLPKTCLTCKYMDFVDDECEDLRCFHTLNMKNSIDGLSVEDTDVCQFYELNQAVKADADMGMW